MRLHGGAGKFAVTGCDGMDQILVLRRGRVVERGTHAELLARTGEYAALWRRQTRES